MSKVVEELHAIYLYERQRWDDTALVECEPPQEGQGDMFDAKAAITIKLKCEPDELDRGLSYRFYGSWTTHPKYGKQFVASTFVRVQPHNQSGVIAYLMKAPNIGLQTAKALWSKFQGQAVRIVRESPDVAVAAVGGQFNTEKANEAAAFLEMEKGLESCTIDLIGILNGRGVPRDTAKKAIKVWGPHAARIIQKNPYVLMRFRGCGFLRTDQMYLDLGHDKNKLKRQALCVWYGMAKDTEGHTWHPKTFVLEQLRGKISGTSIRGPESVKLARRCGIVSVRWVGQELWLAEGKKSRAEATVAECVERLMVDEANWPDPANLDVSDHQREELAAALSQRKSIAILTGSPGTGKTYSTARVIAALADEHGISNVTVVAPTGKAAVRLSEALEAYAVPIRATTIHRALGVTTGGEGDGWAFEHNAANPLDAKVIVVEEASMVGVGLAASLLVAVAKGAMVLFIGDPNQLPPVEHGRPLFDMVAAGVPRGDLKEIRRNSGTIVKACASIRDGQRFEIDDKLDIPNGKNLKLIQAASGESATDKIIATINSIRHKGLCDPIWDCQVIVAVNKTSPLSRRELNRRLQQELNPIGATAKGSPFRVGDKIVCLKNGFLPLADKNADTDAEAVEDEDGDVFVANGEQARVVEVAEKFTIAKFTGPDRLLKIPRGESKGEGGDDEEADTGCSFDLGYAISCHKSQGSEWPVVLVALDEYAGARMVCCREWLYTAISRAKQVCFLVGKRSTADAMIHRRAIGKRKTFLVETIRELQEARSHETQPPRSEVEAVPSPRPGNEHSMQPAGSR